jgi:hypothetical protein
MARSLRFRLFSLFMAAVVLTTSTGFGLIERSCLMRGQKTYSFTKRELPQSCTKTDAKAPVSPQPTVKKDKCCDDRDVYKNVSFTELLAQKAAQGAKAVANAAVAVVEWAASGLVAAVLSLVQQSAETSLTAVPLAGRNLLVFVQSFLI